MSGALAGRKETDLDKGRVGATRVKRYFQGQVPDWVDKDEEEEETVVPEPIAKTDVAAPVIVQRADDPRLRRLAQRRQVESESEEEEDETSFRDEIERPSFRRRPRDDSEEEEQQEEDDEEEEDEEEIERRRAAVRERLKSRQEEELLVTVQEEEEDDEEESSEYETDDSDENYGRPLMKPLFVPKTDRETIEERKQLEREEQLQQEKEKQRKQERQKETRSLVVDIIKADASHKVIEDGPVSLDDVNTDDEIDEEAEYEAWKTREMRRIKQDRDEAEREQRELLEKEKWRNMTEAERQRWLAENAQATDKNSKKKWKFLQKYWHKGAFFQDDADDAFGTTNRDTVMTRDYSAPTGEDVMDKTILPKIMQVKNFGRRGRTKWNHLVAEDTTSWESPWMMNDAMRTKYNKKMAGMDPTFEKPKTLKR